MMFMKNKGYSAVERMEQEIADLKAKNAGLNETADRMAQSINILAKEKVELKAQWEKLFFIFKRGCGTKIFEGHYKCRPENLCPCCERAIKFMQVLEPICEIPKHTCEKCGFPMEHVIGGAFACQKCGHRYAPTFREPESESKRFERNRGARRRRVTFKTKDGKATFLKPKPRVLKISKVEVVDTPKRFMDELFGKGASE
jgi:uncharacterized Zn finger protein (UPF0148 family)